MTELLWDGLHGHPVRDSHAQVVDRVGAAIVGGRFAPGDALPSDEAPASSLGVSRTVLREGFKTPMGKGLLVARVRVGTKVRPRDDWNMLDADVLRWHLDAGAGPTFVRELAEMRLGVEPHAAGLAAARADDEAIATMWTHLDLMAGAHDGAAFAYADFQFHREIIRAAGNPFMLAVGTLIEAALLASFRISSPAESRDGLRRRSTRTRPSSSSSRRATRRAPRRRCARSSWRGATGWRGRPKGALKSPQVYEAAAEILGRQAALRGRTARCR